MSIPLNRFDATKQAALLERVHAGDSIKNASEALGFANVTIFKLAARDAHFKAALAIARAEGKTRSTARRCARTREVMAAVMGAPAPQPEARPVNGRRPVGRVIGDALYLDIPELMNQFAPIVAQLVARRGD